MPKKVNQVIPICIECLYFDWFPWFIVHVIDCWYKCDCLWVVLTSLSTLFNITCWHSLAGQHPNDASFSENDRENVNSTERQGFFKIQLWRVLSLESSKELSDKEITNPVSHEKNPVFWTSQNNEEKILTPKELGQGLFGKRDVCTKTYYCRSLIAR